MVGSAPGIKTFFGRKCFTFFLLNSKKNNSNIYSDENFKKLERFSYKKCFFAMSVCEVSFNLSKTFIDTMGQTLKVRFMFKEPNMVSLLYETQNIIKLQKNDWSFFEC